MKTNFEKGITVISLVITIVLMLILGSVIVAGAINGDLFKKAGETNLEEEIATIKIALDKKIMLNGGKVPDGTVKEILGIDSKYNESLSIEGNELIYISSKWSEEDLKILEDMGIFGGIFDKYNSNKDTIYYIANEETVNSDLFKPLKNMGTLEDFRDLVNAGNFEYEEAELIEDIKLNEGKYEVTDEGITFAADAKEWVPIKNFYKDLNGNGYTISGIYINKTSTNNIGFIENLYGTVEKLGLINGRINANREIRRYGLSNTKWSNYFGLL